MAQCSSEQRRRRHVGIDKAELSIEPVHQGIFDFSCRGIELEPQLTQHVAGQIHHCSRDQPQDNRHGHGGEEREQEHDQDDQALTLV